MEKERISLEKLYKLLEFPAEVVERLGRVQLDKDEETMRDIHLLADREKWQGARARLKEKYAPDEDGMKILACMMRAMQDSYALYIEEKIPEKIFADTMKCFTRFLKEHVVSFGCCGFDRDFWTGRQLPCFCSGLESWSLRSFLRMVKRQSCRRMRNIFIIFFMCISRRMQICRRSGVTNHFEWQSSFLQNIFRRRRAANLPVIPGC